MNTIMLFCFVLFLLFLIVSSHRYLQMVWWNAALFGWRSTFKDLRGLTRTYMAIGNVFLTSNSFFNEFQLDLHRAGIGISCKKGTRITHVLHATKPLSEQTRKFLVDVSELIRGDKLWVSHTQSNMDQTDVEIMRINGFDVDRYGITPVTLAYYHLTKDNVKRNVSSQRVHYGSSRLHQNRNLPIQRNHNPVLDNLRLLDFKRN